MARIKKRKTKPAQQKKQKAKPAQRAQTKTATAATKAKGKATKAKAKAAAKRKRKPAATVTSSISKRVGGVWPANQPYDRAVTLLHSDPRSAVKLFKSAAKLQPDRARIHINLAWALSTLGLHAEARAAAQRAHELDPQDAYVAARRVHVLFAAGDDAVIEAARHAMQIPDMDLEDRRYAHSAICWTLMRTAPAAAVRETEQLVAESPDHAEALAARGCALAAVCRWDDGVTWLDKAIAADPADSRFPMRRSQIMDARAVAEAAMKQLRDDAESRPGDANGWRELGLGLARFARLSEALQAFERARALEPVDTGKKLEPLVVAALMVEATARSYVVIGDITPIG